MLLALFLACSDPAADKPKAEMVDRTAAPAQAATPVAAPPAVPAKVVDLTGKVGFTASKVTASHNGDFGVWNGKATVAGDKLQAIEFEVQIDSIKTESEKLDGHLKSPDFFDATTNPTAKFVSTSIMAGNDPSGKLAEANTTIEGDLTLHGVTQRVKFPAVVTSGAEGFEARTEFVIKRQDFKIVYPGKPDDLIRDDVVIKVDVAAKA